MTKTSKKSVIVSAVLAIALCVSLAVGATFALFTSESPVNIAVTSGKVKIEATISDLNAYSPTTIAQDSDNTITNADNAAINSGDTHQFANGGTVSVEGNEIKIVNITSGDKVTFKITITNYSNVKAKYRTTVQKGNDDGLYAGLKFNIGGLYVESSTLWTDLATVTDTENGEVVAEYTCTVELPANAGNTYQGKSCSIAYNVEAVQGNAETVNDSESSNITTEATETVTTTKDANNNTVVAQEVSIVSKDSIAVSENQTVSAAKATVPANVQLDENADSLTLSVKETDVPSNITVVDTATKEAKNFDIKVTGVSENNQEPITVSVYVGKGLSGVAVYHTHGDSTTEMEDAVYDVATGILTIKTANFSDFTIVYDAITKVSSADELVKALEDGSKCIKLTSDITISPEEYNVKNRLNVETDNLTIDLNGKTLTVSNYTLILDGDNITLMNGEMMTTTINSSQTYGSYAVVPHGKNIIITGVKMLGGVNVTGDNSGNAERDTTVTITNCEITATNYYTVCAQSNAEATIENTKLIGGAGTFFWVEEKGYSEDGAPLAKVSSKIIYDAKTVKFEGNNGLYNPVGVAVVAKNLTVKDAEGKEQTIDAVAVSTEAHLRTLVAAGENVMLASDITLTAPITIGTTSTNNTTIAIVGNGHKLDGSSITSGKEPRAINVWDGTNMIVILNDLTVIGPEAASGRGITTGGTKGLTLILDDCEVSASYYAINVYEDANNVYNPKVIVRNTTLKNVSGYCAINIWAQGTNATFENCTLIGVNNWSGTSDDFATIVINATAKNSTLTFKNCTIKAIEQGTAKEYLYDVRSGATGAKVTFDGCTFFVNGTEVTGDAIQSNMKTQIDTSLTIK